MSNPLCVLDIDFTKVDARDGQTFMSQDAYGHECVVMGGAVRHGNQGLYFNGVDSYIDLGVDPIYDITGDITISVLINPTFLNAVNVILCRGGGSTDGYYFLYYNTGIFAYKTNQTGATQVSQSAAGVLTDGDWQLITATRNGSTGKLYKNGIDVTGSTENHIDPQSTNKNCYIGCYEMFLHHAESLYKFIRIDNYGWTPQEVLSNYIELHHNGFL